MAAEPRHQVGWIARLAIAALLALGAIGVTAAGAQAVPKGFYGVVPQAPLGTADYARMGQGKVGTLRVQLNWAGSDPTATAGDYDFHVFDAVVAGAAANGVAVLPFVYGTPSWVATGIDGYGCGADCGTFAPKSPAALDALSSFIGAAVARYGDNGSFWAQNPALPYKPIAAWQIWNEQNSKSFYAPKPKPKRYAKLLKAADGAVRAEDRSADVVLGGMAELAGSRKAVKGSKYLKKLYRVKGAKKSFDGVAPHPYGAKVSTVVDQIELFRAVMKKAKDKRTDLWITELGWGSAKGGNPLNRGTKGQAKRLKGAFKYFKKHRRKLRIENVDWFTWSDSENRICAWCSTAGLFEAGLAPKPAWRAFTKFTHGS
ncbi:MAG: hypothetical protein GEU88_17885 [Solirubrobacterales bacterium]|nr:hypothetical protein [Solirubrobacterales bacterium]